MSTRLEESQKVLHLVVPAKAEYLSVVRIVVAGIANHIGLGADNTADVKVALSEAASNVIRHAYSEDCPDNDRVLEIDCYDDKGELVLAVTDNGKGMSIPPPPSDGLGFGIMASLMDKVDVETDSDGTYLLMRKMASPGR